MLLVAFIRYSAHSFFGLIFGISKMPLLPEREKGWWIRADLRSG
jgi:hypothetical protein